MPDPQTTARQVPYSDGTLSREIEDVPVHHQTPGTNSEAVKAIADHYCIQRDPRRTAGVIGEVMAECARRLTEGYILNGNSFEALATVWVWDDLPRSTRYDLVKTAAAYIEEIILFDVYAREEPSDAQ